MKLPYVLFAAVLAVASSLAAAHPHDAPPAPPAPPALPAPPAPPASPMDAPSASAPVPPLPAMPAMPALPPMPPAPPAPPAIDIPDDVLQACEGKANGAHISMTASNGARVTGTCRKRGNVYAFILNSYHLNRSR